VLFNSFEFIFVFLPATLLIYYAVRKASHGTALAWLIIASVLFYAWWRPFNLLILGPSVAVNYICARALVALRGDARPRLRTAVLVLGILFNVAVLGWFKYANFAVTVANDVAGSQFVLQEIILPLGISFITFQKIAFLADVAGGRIERFSLRDFLLFVTFFPQLIAGPIVHYRETAPQFQDRDRRFDPELFAAGVTLFCFGLFKKVVLADGMAQHVSPIFAFAAAGGEPTLLQGWQAAVGFTLQIYFDFSGYSDMACGAALLFGIRLPLNFDSPLKAGNIIDFWLRWHVTLTRFLTAYVYNPITLAITRARATKKLPLLKGRASRVGAFLAVLAGPTLLTMLLSGVWHGAGYTFLIWGLLQGGYLVANHAWRQYVPARSRGRGAAVLGFLVTFAAVAVAMVFFRAPDVATAMEILRGMAGLNGVSLPARLAELAPLPGIATMQLAGGEVDTRDFLMGLAYLGALLAIALAPPNTLQVLFDQKPVLNAPAAAPEPDGLALTLRWRPTLPWMAFVSMLGAIAITQLSGESEFLYWQF
jgi:D-alanyl-lipoteichoic acid acyltransferase DltB (MBOAT superfamily)